MRHTFLHYLNIQNRCLLLKEHFLTGRLLTSGIEDEMLTVNMVAMAHRSALRYLLEPSSYLAFH